MLDAATLEAIALEAKNCFLYEDGPEYMTMLKDGIEQLRGIFQKSKSPDNLQETYKELERAAHSLKGGAGMAQLQTLNQLAHKIEDIFEALEQGRVQDQRTALELITVGVEELENLFDAAIQGQADAPEGDNPTQELIAALEEFIATLEVAKEDNSQGGDHSSFIKIALTSDLDTCLQQLEELIPQSPDTLAQGLTVFEEECNLLGQALSCQWLEEIVTAIRQVKELNKISLSELAKLAIAEVKQLRESFLANQTPTFSANLTQLLPAPKPAVEETPTETQKTEAEPQKSQEKTSSTQLPSINLRIPIERLNRMGNTVGELIISHERLLLYNNLLKQASHNLKKRNKSLVPLLENVETLYDQLTITEQKPQTNQEKEEEFDSLQLDKYTDLHTSLQRFQELMVQVQEIREDIDLVSREVQELGVEMRQYIDSLDTDLTQSRLVTFATLAHSFVQPIESLNQRHNKSAQLIIEGENVLVDQGILEQLRTPLTHLIRNAFDHGLETPQERVKLGKPRTGEIKLAAIVKSNHVLIIITDDGHGINLKKVYQKAIKTGLCSEDTPLQKLTKQEVLDFIFAPGFSTAEQVSSLSGRGMGLDIVRLQIERLRGTLRVETTSGQGSQFIIRIPLSLNILPLLLARCQKQTLAIPSESIKRIIRLSDFPIHKSKITIQDKSLPVVPLYKLLPYTQPGIFEPNSLMPNVGLILDFENKTIVVAIDKIVGERELVVKPFDDLIPVPSYVAGCTILGTGEVVPILVPEYFGELIRSKTKRKTASKEAKPIKVSKQPSILIIDDSIAVRRTLNRLLTQSGYQVVQARDGKEAWAELNRHNVHFDLAICDLEMPGMDGFTLLQMVRADHSWQNLPFIILTSRESDIHREKAMNLGANDYHTKPFHPVKFLQAIAPYFPT